MSPKITKKSNSTEVLANKTAPTKTGPTESEEAEKPDNKHSPSNDTANSTNSILKDDNKSSLQKEPSKTSDRLAKLASLRTLKRDSVLANRSAVHTEYTKVHTDSSFASKSARLRARAEEELSKLDAEEKGEDFERKRAWDWTVQESEEWDKKLSEKKERENRRGFSDYQTMAYTAYDKEIREQQRGSKEDLEKYQKRKLEQVKKHATLIEDEDGNIIAYDKDGTLGLAGMGSSVGAALDQYEHQPEKEDVDNLVNAMTKGDAQRMKRRKKNDESGELVSYINDKNKQFNDKLSRYYNEYTKDVRDAFERGTAL